MAELKGNTPGKANASSGESRIDILKKKINNKEYLSEAIQRIASVLSSEIAGASGGGAIERKRS